MLIVLKSFKKSYMKTNATGRPLVSGPVSLVTFLPALREGRIPVRAGSSSGPGLAGSRVPAGPPPLLGVDALQGEEPG